MSAAFVLTQDKFQVELAALWKEAKNPRALLLGVGREAQQLLKRHFRMKDRTEANHLSARRSHFWREIDLSVTQPVIVLGDTAVKIAITDGRFAQKLFGGRIVPKEAKALTIPVSEESYGRTAATFEAETGLKLFLIKGSGFALLATRRDPHSKFLQIEYVLAPWVDQDKDPTALPDMRAGSPFMAALLARGRVMIERMKATPHLNN